MKLLRRIQLPIALAVVLFTSQCQQVETEPPKADGFDPPIPSQISYLAGPITFQLTELEKKINKELDPVLVGKKTKGGIFSFRIERSGPVHIQYVDQQIRFSAPLQIWLIQPFGASDTSPQKPFCALQVNFQSPLRVTPNWRLASNVKFTDYQWISEPEIRLFGKEISLTNFAQRILDNHRTSIEKAIDTAVYEDLRLDAMVKPVWQDIQKPLLLEKEYGLWLIPKPISVAASPITGNTKQITTHLRIAFETRTDLKSEEPVQPLVPLPQLQKRDTVSQIADLRVVGFIPYADINRMLSRILSKEPKKVALGTLTINKASVYGGQRTVIVKTEVNGLVDGTLYLRGRPVFDTLTKTLHVKDLDFDAQTDNALSKFSNTVVHKGLRKLMERMLVIPMGSEIEQLPKKINEAFEKGPGKKTDLGIQSFRLVPQTIAVRPDGIQVLIHVQSKVAIHIQKL
ncbi:DUF4403 family protein [Spirosoma oryzicola]|uniref:DUF4403 family protein n=1 Tax=Spirosoma oryzicola TaxID=2898794 RepID=UPI001E4B39B1|nr:DUF4403 family protein [Spirosoma oryzicola]UHG89652.1 DUF4403 family protein [Spirosoma oryzicola]